jgi:hypothetical protein
VFFLSGDGVVAHRPNPQPGGPVYLFVWVLSFDLSDKGGPTSSYATAGIALSLWMPWGDLPEYHEKIKLEIQPLDNKLEKMNQL